MKEEYMEQITSRKNPYIRQLASAVKRGGCAPIFMIEGPKMIKEAVQSGKVPQAVLLGQSNQARELYQLLKDKNVNMIRVTDEIINLLCNTKTPQGVVAVMNREAKAALSAAQIKDCGLYVVLEDVSDPGNVGTILRTSEAFGVDGVILCGQCADIYNEKTLRATMGAVFRMNVWRQEEIGGVLQILKECDIAAYGAALDDNCVMLGNEALDFKRGCAVIIGNESRGLSVKAKQGCDIIIKIPMCSATESLNAAVASSVILWEAFCQRENH